MISIRWRLTLLLCLAMGLLLVLTGAGAFFAMRQILHAGFDETLTAKAQALISASEVDDGDFEIDFAVQDFAGFGKNGDDYFEVRRTNGGLMLRSPSLRGEGRAIDRFDRFAPPAEGGPVILGDRLADGRRARFFVQRIVPKDDEDGLFRETYLIVASPTRAMDRELAVLATVLSVAGGMAVLLMIPLIRLGTDKGLRPLDELSDDISSIRSEELHRRLPSHKLPAELRSVALSLNEWLERLEESFERERRFSSHAAHELRTPLAEIRSIAELGARWPEEANPQNCAEIVAVTGELEELLDKLALLARADAGQQPVVRETIDPAALTASVLARFEKKSRERGIKFQSDISEEPVFTDRHLWNAIMQNLVGNAVIHAPVGSVVKLRIFPKHISISNPAPDLSPGDLPHLFERFWRKDESRSGYGHSGLGMAITKTSASLLGAGCSASLTESGELLIEVSFPG